MLLRSAGKRRLEPSIPAEGDPVLPDIVISPIVGIDPTITAWVTRRFFDRTLAAMPFKPLVIGVWLQLQRIATSIRSRTTFRWTLVTEAS